MRWLTYQWWRDLLRRGEPVTHRAIFVSDEPEKLRTDRLYLVGEEGNLWFAVMLCPCGCGERLHMSLHAEGRPRWHASDHGRGVVSLSPSVWRRVGCRSHFFLRRGRISWV